MKVLVGHECSGIVREAFRALGHDAWSCDVKDAEDGSAFHMRRSVLDHDVVHGGWDLLIAHPDCTYLVISGNRWAGADWRMEARNAAVYHVRALWALPIALKCIENPIGILSTVWRKPTQIIQPHDYGHDASKSTCLWLDGLPPLRPTGFAAPRVVESRNATQAQLFDDFDGAADLVRWSNQSDAGHNILQPAPTRSADRSRTYHGIARAMAAQWSSVGKNFVERVES